MTKPDDPLMKALLKARRPPIPQGNPSKALIKHLLKAQIEAFEECRLIARGNCKGGSQLYWRGRSDAASEINARLHELEAELEDLK